MEPTEINSEENKAGQKSKSKSTLLSFLMKNIITIVLLLGIIFVYFWFSNKISNNTDRFENEKTQLITKYETERDSLQMKHLAFASTVFSWSLRSEFLRTNIENSNQLLNVFVKESGADLVQIVNPENNVVILSSDKKFEGIQYGHPLDFDIPNTIVLKEVGLIRVLTPIMGFNSKIGMLVVEFKSTK